METNFREESGNSSNDAIALLDELRKDPGNVVRFITNQAGQLATIAWRTRKQKNLTLRYSSVVVQDKASNSNK